jgi:signal transduction histidine kinase
VSAQSERISAIAHDLRNPLAAIAGYAELLQSREDAAFRVEAARNIGEAAERLSVAIEKLLAELATPRD